MQFVDKKIAVLGLGKEGRDLLAWLRANTQNCRIKVFDKIKTIDLSGFDFVFRSPGFWRLSPMFSQTGAEISSATKLFFNLCPAKIIGVTGTKGKGTTTTLIYQMLKSQGKRAFIAGNIGKPMLKLLPQLKTDDWVCLELSSFQLQDLTLSPRIAVVLNITRDHLDIHRNISEYRQAKANLVCYQQKSDHAVLNADYAAVKRLAVLTQAKIHWFSRRRLAIDKQRVKLRGEHNLENIAAAMATADLAGVSRKNILKVIYGFKGLKHRLEPVRTVGGVAYFNDSFSTTPETAIAAINSFTEPLIIILGGSDKGSDYRQLGREIGRRPNLKAIILIGKMGPVIRKAITNYQGLIIEGKNKMKLIVQQAQKLAVRGDAVVLSPACASFDMFKDYQDRGNQFRLWVNQL